MIGLSLQSRQRNRSVPRRRRLDVVKTPNPYMASSVNSAHHGRRKISVLPRRYNRTAVDRFANGCKGLSDRGGSVQLHQTLSQGSATGPRKARRPWDRKPTPKKLIRTPTPALPEAGLL